MNNIEFSSTAKNIATNYKTLYILIVIDTPFYALLIGLSNPLTIIMIFIIYTVKQELIK